MELKELKVFIVGNKHPGWGGKYFVFVKLTTNNGFVVMVKYIQHPFLLKK